MHLKPKFLFAETLFQSFKFEKKKTSTLYYLHAIKGTIPTTAKAMATSTQLAMVDISSLLWSLQWLRVVAP